MMIYLSNLLSREWNKVTFYTFDYDENLFHWKTNFDVIVSNKMSIMKKIKNSDYIIIWNSPMQFIWVMSKIFFRSKAKIIWWHHHYPWYYRWDTNFLILAKRFLEKLSLKYIDEVVVNSMYLKNSLEEIYWIRSKILYPTIDTEFTSKTFFDKKDFTQKTIFTYWRRVKWKNIRQIFDTYDYLKSKSQKFELIVWWIWDELDLFKDSYKNEKNISFLWLLDNKSIINNLNATHVFLFPSKIDSFWMTIIEAMSQSVPVVAFDLNWAKEIIKTNENWFLVKTKDEFSQKTYLLLNDSQLNNKFSKKCLDTAKNFTESKFKKQLEKIL